MKFTLSTATILNSLFPGYWPLIGAQGLNTIVAPAGNIKVIYKAGTVAFGGSPAIQLGYPGSLAYFGNANQFDLTLTDSQGTLFSHSDAYPALLLSDFTNQPLVVSLADASATYGPILTSSLTDGGVDYAVGDKAQLLGFDTAGAQTFLTVATVDGSGAILTYTLTTTSAAAQAASVDYGLYSPGAATVRDAMGAVTIVDAGSGFVVNEYATIGSGIDTVLLQVTSIDGGGAVTGLAVRNPGNGTSGPNIDAVASGFGTGLTVDIAHSIGAGATFDLTVTQGNGIIEVHFLPEVTRI